MDAVNDEMFQTEVKQVEKLLFRVAWSYLSNMQDVEDAVQEALFKAWEKRATLRSEERFKAWLARIVVNQCKNILRRRKKGSFYPLEGNELMACSPEEAPVLEAMNKLKPEQRAAVTLYYLDGYTLPEIALLLGCPVGTVKTRLHAARKRLRTILLVEWEEKL